jgi:hypothetical protein
VPKCDVLSIYDSYLSVEVQLDYILMEDTYSGSNHGFTMHRGSLTATSTVYAGVHGLTASNWRAMNEK